jgi:hypothetical protein
MTETQTRYPIEITEEDIAKAKRNDSYACVVAQALARTIPDAHHIDVDTQSIRFTRGPRRLVYLTPYAVQGYVVAFDAGEAIEPFTFILREPSKVKTKRLTALGRTAASHAQRARRKLQGEAKKAGKDLTAPEVVEDVRAAVTAAYRAVTATEPDQKIHEMLGEGRHRKVPRVFKSRKRTYGHRVLRINQTPGDFAIEKLAKLQAKDPVTT